MKLVKKVCLTTLLSILPLAAFAGEPTSCPPLSTIIANADTMDTVSAVFGKIDPPRLADFPYIVFSVIPFIYEPDFWFLITTAQTNTMDEGLTAAAENIKRATIIMTPEEHGSVRLCGYATPQDPQGMGSVIAVNFKGLAPNIGSFMKSHVTLKETHHKYSFVLK